uniref:Uncharacterized protein n=1 Tax=Romanomermis culicivorax TaxID=13658 RepID=A0A915JR82_ROMCU
MSQSTSKFVGVARFFCRSLLLWMGKVERMLIKSQERQKLVDERLPSFCTSKQVTILKLRDNPKNRKNTHHSSVSYATRFQFGFGCFSECFGVGTVRSHGAVQTGAAGSKAFLFGFILTVIIGRTESFFGYGPSRREAYEVGDGYAGGIRLASQNQWTAFLSNSNISPNFIKETES